MTQSAYRTLPLCAGSLVTSGPWSSLLARAGYRVYPFQMGAMIAADSTGVTVSLRGQGEFTTSGGTNYAMACSSDYYGDSIIYIPDVTRIQSVSAVDGSNDEITIGDSLTLYADEYLFNLGVDGASNPLVSPNYDGSTISIYSDPVGGGSAISTGYVLTGSQGHFRCYTETGWKTVDLLVTDSSGNPVIVIPHFALGPEIVV